MAAFPAQAIDLCTPSGPRSAGNDTLCGTTGADNFGGDGGDDTLIGQAGNDKLSGGDGNDRLVGGDGEDALAGDAGNDHLSGGNDNDNLIGGDGNDVLVGNTGGDDFNGMAGDDKLFARDGHLDLVIGCQSGIDSLDMDLLDATAFFGNFLWPFVAKCENVTVGAVNEGPNAAISRRSRRVGEDGRTTVRLTCPRSLQRPSRCAGTLKLQLVTRASLRRKAPQTRYRLRPGQRGRISVRLSRRDRSTLRRRGRAKGMITSVEKGHIGNKTTVQAVKLTARR